MHEWALAESVIASSLEYAKHHELRLIKEILLTIGEIQQIDMEIFKFALDEIKKNHEKTKKTIIRFNTEPTLLRCLRCGNEWLYSDTKDSMSSNDKESIHFIPEVYIVHTRCPRCGNPDFEIIKGRGVIIKSIKGVR